MPGFELFGKSKSLEELQEENERLVMENQNAELKLTVAQKQAMYKKLDDAGLTVRKDFGGSMKRAWQWFRTH